LGAILPTLPSFPYHKISIHYIFLPIVHIVGIVILDSILYYGRLVMEQLTVDTNMEVLYDTYDDMEEEILKGMINEVSEEAVTALLSSMKCSALGNYIDANYYKELHLEKLSDVAEMEKRIATKPNKELIVGDNGLMEIQDTIPIDPTAPTFGNMLDFIDPTEYMEV
jgi:hypothetical protein